ncbi:MAG: ribonuclease III [Chlamydiia bacterium]|nr:ribonuclease III [Chlamydiia bacterium]
MDDYETLTNAASEIERNLGYRFQDRSLLAQAFVHRSYVNEHKDIGDGHNERLEFLGDSVLGLIVADYLYRYLPNTPEGELSHLRSRLVEASCCVSYVEALGIEHYVLLGKGERLNQGRGRDSIRADLFEALVGAIYLDGGLDAARGFIFKNFSKQIDAVMRQPMRNWKAELQDYSQKRYHEAPSYTILNESGPDHQKTFEVSVTMNGEEVGRGMGSSKKEAQQIAASDALERLEGKD